MANDTVFPLIGISALDPNVFRSALGWCVCDQPVKNHKNQGCGGCWKCDSCGRYGGCDNQLGASDKPQIVKITYGERVSLYSHRNGETEPPTIEGTFGVRVHDDEDDSKWGMIIDVAIEKGRAMYLVEPKYSYCQELPDGEYWGPITGPWNEVTNG